MSRDLKVMSYEDSLQAAILAENNLPHSIIVKRQEKLFEKYILGAKMIRIKERMAINRFPAGVDDKGEYYVLTVFLWPLDKKFIMENYETDEEFLASMIYDATTCPYEIKVFLKLKWHWEDDELI